MKITIIGAGGKLGREVVSRAAAAGHDVVCVVRKETKFSEDVTVLVKDLFMLEKNDLIGTDAVISTFGGGFHSDPRINRDAFEKYIELLDNSGIPLVVIGGEGSLYADATHKQFAYEQPGHPAMLKEISKNTTLGISLLEQSSGMVWTCVSPPKEFDPKGNAAQSYYLGYERETPHNKDGKSYLSYKTMANVMINIVEAKDYKNSVVTVME